MTHRIIAAAVGLCLAAGSALADGYDSVRVALDAGDYDTAFATLAEMGNAGDTLAMTMLANLQMGYTVANPNYGVAFAWLQQAATAGSIHAMIQLGTIYQFQPMAIDRTAANTGARYPEAISWYQRAIDAGSVVAVSRLGLLHRFGLLPTVDESVTVQDELARAIVLLGEAAAAGRPEAMAPMAMMVRRDDPARAASLMQQAAALGEPTALGLIAIKPGDFGVEDPVEILAWVLAAEARWELDRDPRSGIWTAMGVETETDFRAWVAAERANAASGLLAAAELRAAEIRAGWTSLLPGHSGAPREGGLFGRN
ncbi:MAG: hypothetical protein R3F55_20060 [Alphaproteobacteria bacterium]